MICQTAKSQTPDSITIERLVIPRFQAEQKGIQPSDMLISKEAAQVLREKLDTLSTLKQHYTHLHTENRQLLKQLDSISIMLKKAEAYIGQVDSKRQTLEYQILQDDLSMIRNEQDVLKLRRKILRTLRREPKVIRRYLLFNDAVPKKTKLFGYAIMGTLVLLVATPILLK